MSKTPPALDSSDALLKLKEILLSEDQRRIDALKQELEKLQTRIDDRELLIETLEPVIAELMEKKIIASRHEMAEVLSPIMSEAIKNQVEYAKDEVAEALYPVIGKTIRKSIAEAMRNLVKSVNDKVERAFSPRHFFLRIKARISGVSQADLILKESIPFRVREVFLIHKETGILLAHASDKSSHSEASQDLISGMLTAIKDFAQTIFSGDEAVDLHEIQYENRQIRLEIGQFAYLACITEGIPRENFSGEIAQLNHKVHRKFLHSLRDFKGDVNVFRPAQPLLMRFLHFFDRLENAQAEPCEEPKKRLRFGFVFLLGFLIVLAGVYLGVFVFPKRATARKVQLALTDLETERPGLAKAGLHFDVRRRSVFLSGQVMEPADRESVEDRIDSLPSVREVINGIEVVPWAADPEALYEETRRNLETLSIDLSRIRFVIEGGILYVRGTAASEGEKEKIVEALAAKTALPVIVDNIRLDRELETQRIWQEIEKTVLFFATGQFELEPQELDKLDGIRDNLDDIDFHRLRIVGHADDTGTNDVNLWLSQKRADWVKSYLIEAGIPGDKLEAMARANAEPLAQEKTEQARAMNRRVEFVFDLEERKPR